MKPVRLNIWIADNFESKSEFARAQKVLPQQVTKWVNSGYVVVNSQMMKPMRELNH